MNVVIAAGGTGGHVFPALALADLLVRDHRADVRFIGSANGQEATRVPESGYRFDAVNVAPFYREVSMRAVRAPVIALRSLFACAPLVRGADVAVGMGGYVSVPPMLAARRAHIPIVLHEPNAVPGLANRLLARSSKAIAIAFEDARERLAGGVRVEVVGYPVRQTILDVPADRDALAQEARARWDMDAHRRTVLIMGGSQGSLHLDQVVAEALPSLADREDLQLLVISGPAHEGVVSDAVARASGVRARLVPFLDRMELGYAVADLVVARSGATTLAELAVCGLPALLVPYPHATEHHQDANAREWARIGAAEVVSDAELTAAVFTKRLCGLIDDADRLATMGARAHDRAKPDAAERFARLVAEVAAR